MFESFNPDPKKPKREKKEPKPIRKVSKRLSIDLKLYKQARGEYLSNHTICQRCNIKRVDCVHHLGGRVGSMLYNEKYFMGVCDDCHEYIHANVAESMKKGWLITRLGKKK